MSLPRFCLSATEIVVCPYLPLIAERQFEPALAALLEVVRKDRGALRISARKLMVEVFNLAEGQDEFVGTYRKLLAGALY